MLLDGIASVFVARNAVTRSWRNRSELAVPGRRHPHVRTRLPPPRRSPRNQSVELVLRAHRPNVGRQASLVASGRFLVRLDRGRLREGRDAVLDVPGPLDRRGAPRSGRFSTTADRRGIRQPPTVAGDSASITHSTVRGCVVRSRVSVCVSRSPPYHSDSR